VNPTTGVVTGVASGTVVITATAEGKQGQVTVTVTDPQFLVASLASGSSSGHACAVRDGGAAFCWGENLRGQLGMGQFGGAGTQSYYLTPKAVAGGVAFASVVGGSDHSCGLTSGGTAYCWGSNYIFALGAGTSGDSAASPRAVATTQQFRSLALGASFSCALTAGGAAYCWGANGHGELGNGRVPVNAGDSVRAVAGGLTFSGITAGLYHACGLASTGAWCWGWNTSGQVGDSITDEFDARSKKKVPFAVIGGGQLVSVTAGTQHTCGTNAGGQAFCWGANARGQLGDGTITSRWNVASVSGGLTFARLTAGDLHTCGLTSAGEAWCWGDNRIGQLGDGTTTERHAPVRVAGGLTFRSLSASGVGTCGVTTAGQAYCWGGFMALGSGGGNNRSTPTAVSEPQ
jgi:alpha-tubulin suppressor-like RCC1 family protein